MISIPREGLPGLILWDLVISVFEPDGPAKPPIPMNSTELALVRRNYYDMFGSIDYVPPSLPITYGRAVLIILEDNDAVIKMCIKERFPTLRHVARTHRVDLDWLFERLNRDPAIF